jgi:hypothetical protein
VITSMAPPAPRPTGGIVDDQERDDNQRGYERDETDAHHQLGSYLLRLVREGDQHAARTGRQVPRTVQALRLREEQR